MTTANNAQEPAEVPAPRAPFDPNMSPRAMVERQKAGKLTLEDRRILDDAAQMLHRNEGFGRLRQAISELEAQFERALAPMLSWPPPERIAYLVDRYDRVQDMTLRELADLVDDADNRRLQRQRAREAGSRGGKARQGKHYSAEDHDRWLGMAARLPVTMSLQNKAFRIVDVLKRLGTAGDQPSPRQVRKILSQGKKS